MSDMDWREIAREMGNDKFTDTYAHRYFDFYEHEFRGFRPARIVEIGVQGGKSLRLWKRLFPEAEVVGVDIDPSVRVEGFSVVHVDQAERGAFDWLDWADLVIDDGGHTMRQQVRTFDAVWPKVRPGGAYVIEDLHTGWMAGYGDAQYPLGSTMGMIKRWAEAIQPLSDKAAHGMVSVSVYPSIVFAWKGQQ